MIKYYAGNSKWKPLNDDTDNDQSARITALESGKVDKVEGKELSSNDFTDAYKSKLDGIAAQANKTTVENSLTSTSTTNALAAAQGKALKDLIDALTTRVAALETPAA